MDQEEVTNEWRTGGRVAAQETTKGYVCTKVLGPEGVQPARKGKAGDSCGELGGRRSWS